MLDMGFEPQMREIVSRIRVSPNVMRFMYCGLVCMYVALSIIVNFIDREIDKQLCGVLPGQWQCTVSYVISEIVSFDFTCIHVAITLPRSKEIYICMYCRTCVLWTPWTQPKVYRLSGCPIFT